jgi:hypothetical protein
MDELFEKDADKIAMTFGIKNFPNIESCTFEAKPSDFDVITTLIENIKKSKYKPNKVLYKKDGEVLEFTIN